MVLYTCTRCGYNTTHRTNMKNHLNRKNICKPTLEDVSIEQLCFLYNFDISNFQQETTGFQQETTGFQQVLTGYENTNNSNSCNYCNKTFTRKYGLICHLKICKIKKENDEKKESEQIMIIEIEKLKKQLEQTNNKILNTTNNNNNKILNTTNDNCNNSNSNNNITQNITINNYGEENLKCLSEAYLSKLIECAFTAIPKLIEKIHFNPEYPENQNIKITNKKEPYIKVRKNNKWELQDKKETIDTIVDDKYYILDDHIDILRNPQGSNEPLEDLSDLSEFEKDIMEKFKDRIHNDEDLLKEIKKKSELIILTRSNDIKNGGNI